MRYKYKCNDNIWYDLSDKADRSSLMFYDSINDIEDSLNCINIEKNENYKETNNYEVTKKDLIGRIEDFPIKIVQKMINNQIKQFNKANIKIFQNKENATCYEGGFDWKSSPEGYDYWLNIIAYKNFNYKY